MWLVAPLSREIRIVKKRRSGFPLAGGPPWPLTTRAIDSHAHGNRLEPMQMRTARVSRIRKLQVWCSPRARKRANKAPKMREYAFLRVQRRCVRIWSLCLLFQQFQLGHQDCHLPYRFSHGAACTLGARPTNQNQLVRLSTSTISLKHNSRKTCL